MLAGHISLIPKSLVLSQLLLYFNSNDHFFCQKLGYVVLKTRIFEV